MAVAGDQLAAAERPLGRRFGTPAGPTEVRPGGKRGLPRWPLYVGGALTLLYVLILVRGLAWQWQAIAFATQATLPAPVVRGAPNPLGGPAGIAAPRAGAAQPAQPAQSASAKVPLPPTDEPPPRDATDRYSVYYDALGVAVVGIDADPGGVYNVPPGRQVRIGGPQGQLFDVLPGGKISPATKVKEWPR
ncbi:MAG: hypothetical protein HY332_03215 [Chloroflexi bacterium]|nr:hypothetical protein [Chloroflexota bacterium]